MEVILYDLTKYLCTLSLAPRDTLYPLADSSILRSQCGAQSSHQLVQILILGNICYLFLQMTFPC